MRVERAYQSGRLSDPSQEEDFYDIKADRGQEAGDVIDTIPLSSSPRPSTPPHQETHIKVGAACSRLSSQNL